MTDPQIRVMLSTEDFRHLVEGGELRVITDKGTACVCLDEIGYEAMSGIVDHAALYDENRLGEVKCRQARA